MQLREHFGDYAGGLEHALALATLAHASQRQAYGASSSMHPVRMALVLPDDDREARTAALLSEVIEDTELTLDDLRSEGFPEHIIQAVDAMTFRPARFANLDESRLAQYESALQIFDIAS